jgi:Zn-dependent peptidase ImmA (M78 family)
MARPVVKVEPLIMKYARHCSGYDLAAAAKKIKVSEDKLRAFEQEQSEVTLGELKRVSAAYKMPLAYFLLKKAPADVVVPDAFRVVYDSEDQGFSPTLMLAVRNARYAQSVVQELSGKDIKYPFRAVTIKDDPEKVASYFRGILGVDLEDQKKWSDPAVALRGWKDAVERLGIFILQQSLTKDDVSAFSLADQKPYVVLLNSSEHENRRIFSLFHEVAHILLHTSGVCTPTNLSRNSYAYKQIEKFCNQFSASFLVPQADFTANEIVKRLGKLSFEKWSPNDIKTLASLYRVSQEVIYRRLVQVGVLGEEEYEQKRSELMKSFEEYKKLPKKENLIIPQYRKIISKNGRAYSGLILENLHSNRITLSDAAEYLGTNTQHISAVESHM